jgi:hypothetical protein
MKDMRLIQKNALNALVFLMSLNALLFVPREPAFLTLIGGKARKSLKLNIIDFTANSKFIKQRAGELFNFFCPLILKQKGMWSWAKGG